MKTIEQLQKELEEAKLAAQEAAKRQHELQSALEEAERAQSVRFLPKVGEEYWCVAADRSIRKYHWENDTIDISMFSIGNVYRTEKEAEAIVQNRKVHVALQELAGGFKPDWEDRNQVKKYLNWEHTRDPKIHWQCSWEPTVWFDDAINQSPSTVYFPEGFKRASYIQQQIDAQFGEGALKQYLTGSLV